MRRTLRSIRAAFLLFSSCAAALGTVAVDPPRAAADDNAEARHYFDVGNRVITQAYRARGARRRALFEEALAAFVQSIRIVRSRNAIFNAGVAVEELGRVDEAFNYYSEYLAMPDLTDADRIEASRRREALRPRVAVAAVSTVPPGAEVRVDRQDLAPVGVTPLEIALPEGEHTFMLALAGHAGTRVTGTTATGARVEVRATLTPDPVQGPENPPDASPAILRVRANVAFRVAVDGHWFNTTEIMPEDPAGLEVRIVPGHRDVTITAAGYGEARTSVDALAGRTVQVTAELQPLATGETELGAWPTALWIATGVAAAGGLALGGAALGANADYEDAVDTTASDAELERLAQDVDDANLRADILWGITAGLLVTSIVLTAMNTPVEADPSTLQIAAAPIDGGVMLAARGTWGSP